MRLLLAIAVSLLALPARAGGLSEDLTARRARLLETLADDTIAIF